MDAFHVTMLHVACSAFHAHPGSIFPRLWEGADRPGRAKRPKVGRAVTAIALAFISFHFCLLGLHFLSFWLLSFHFCLLGFHFLSFWPFGPLFPFILAFWAFISFHFGFLKAGPCCPPISCKKLPVSVRNLNGIYQRTRSIWQLLALWAFVSSAFISFHFGILGLHFLSFWPFGPSCLCIFSSSGWLVGSPPQVPKNGSFS